ncbi:MAG: Orotidine 5'-phosphate decarboxylase [Candidatus Nomurabacteria bacterium GW2011_GWB1_37_5]|uniref:Orotidine 5'-phosphate decarboxylase n=1 Tax=Candidatus Nomurabacteria bacterium GW2011_GWB1_37_5 TaxID=1618742 RepID=A0A0G0GU07_9BACT|nr:MAG: Orotidine 5'-phosphate decarboxylase [Candidatus Nomurabacteria bacterium GW2011_GWB1_37_5]
MRNFMQMLRAKWTEGKFVCVGLDTDYDKIPLSVKNGLSRSLIDEERICWGIYQFNKKIIDATKDIVCAYKPNSAFYEQYGATGLKGLEKTIAYIHEVAPSMPVILDAKRADIGNTNEGYVKFAFDYLKADAITVHPYLGSEAMKPFLDCKDKGIIVLCRTSNKGAEEFQNFGVSASSMVSFHGDYLYRHVAHTIRHKWNYNKNCLLLVGATYPDELKEVRKIVGDMPILIPGIGAQGGDLEKTLEAGFDSKKEGIIINSSRGIIYASNGVDFAEAARRETLKLHDAISAQRSLSLQFDRA